MEKLVVIDGNFWLFSCYYATAAMGNLMVNKDGIPTNAVYGFANRLESLLKQDTEENQRLMNLFVSFQWLENF